MPAGTQMVRVAIGNLRATEPSAGGVARRFSPVRDAARRRVPVLYAGQDLGCALAETVFHDLPDDAAVAGEVFRADLVAVRAGTVIVTADLSLADLTDAALAGHGLSRCEIVDTSPQEYDVTRLWGQHAWDTTHCAGLVWNSRRSPDRLAFMLFVDPPRVADRARVISRRRQLDVVAPPRLLFDGDGLAATMSAAADRNVTVVL